MDQRIDDSGEIFYDCEEIIQDNLNENKSLNNGFNYTKDLNKINYSIEDKFK